MIDDSGSLEDTREQVQTVAEAVTRTEAAQTARQSGKPKYHDE